MATQASRLAHLLTFTYASRINAQLVYPASSTVVKPNELKSALMRPLMTATYEPERSVSYLAATLAYGVIQGHPFLDGNKRTAFLLAHEYMRIHGLSGHVGGSNTYEELIALAERYIGVATGDLDVGALAAECKKN